MSKLDTSKRIADTIYTFRFLRILTMKWEDMGAYKYGIIDKDGSILRKARELNHHEEKASYTLFHRLVFNVKRLLEKLPLGKSRIASYAAALYLIKEKYGIEEEHIKYVLLEVNNEIDATVEDTFFLTEDRLSPGTYKLKDSVVSPVTGNIIGYPGDAVSLKEGKAIDSILGVGVYECCHEATKTKVFITSENICR